MKDKISYNRNWRSGRYETHSPKFHARECVVAEVTEFYTGLLGIESRVKEHSGIERSGSGVVSKIML